MDKLEDKETEKKEIHEATNDLIDVEKQEDKETEKKEVPEATTIEENQDHPSKAGKNKKGGKGKGGKH